MNHGLVLNYLINDCLDEHEHSIIIIREDLVTDSQRLPQWITKLSVNYESYSIKIHKISHAIKHTKLENF